MSAYFTLLSVIAPVFILMAIGGIARRAAWLSHEADASLLKLVVNLLYPCLVFESVLGNDALRNPSNLFWSPIVGFMTIVLGFAVAWQAGKWLGLGVGSGLRTFAFSVGIYNYGYIPIPLISGLFSKNEVGVLLVHNVGCEAAMWTVGILVLAGLSLREGWRKLVNPPVLSLVAAVAGNAIHVRDLLPTFVLTSIHSLAVCAIPIALIIVGATLSEYLNKPADLFDSKITVSACVLRLGLLPILFLIIARFLPCSDALKRVMVVEASMPTGLLLLVIAKNYGGQTLTAVQIIVGTTALSLLVIPLWIHVGLRFVGV